MSLLLTETKKSQYEELSLLMAMFVDDEFQWLGNEEQVELWKPGYPGIIIVEGLYDNVQEYISRLKNLRWQAITVRSEETETFENYDDDNNNVPLKKDDYKGYLKLKLECNNPGISEMKDMSEISSR
ncbi:7413_t:CDS:2 [Diversispora eburnea]|uniref:7413_t:CDS:1 n=1 Tax=Diversispora eburnea TaxID=1213867 RepID=A0A9N8YU48_9GLOM|nr:7413_t:CDS:2 [Diversispora eburnea]